MHSMRYACKSIFPNKYNFGVAYQQIRNYSYVVCTYEAYLAPWSQPNLLVVDEANAKS